MKILFLTNIPSPYRVSFFSELGKLCDLTVIYERRTASDRDDSWEPIESNSFNEIFLKGIKVSRGFAFNPGVVSHLKNNRYDLVVIGGYSSPTGMIAIEYCKLKKIPFILNADGGVIRKEPKWQHRIKKHFISSADLWLSTGERTSEYLEHYGADPYNIRTYPLTSLHKNDILSEPLSKEDKANVKMRLGLQDKPTAISVGSFIHRKGFDILIDSWSKVDPDFNLVIIGGGEERGNLDQQISSLGLKNVTLLNFVSPDRLRDYYQASDLFVMPTREDIWGLVVNEAMANGLPVITSDSCVAGVELVENARNGYVVPSEDSLSFGWRVNEVLSDSELTLQMGVENIKKIKHYTFEAMAERHMDIFNNLLTPYHVYY